MNVGSLSHSWVFHPNSTDARAIWDLFSWILILLGVIFLIVVGLVAYISIRYRARGSSSEPKADFGNRKLETIWTIIPLLILFVVFYFTVRTMQAADAPSDGEPPDLIITGHQWWWEIRYPKAGIVTANEIHLPVGHRLLAEIRAADVIHDFWVPELARKIDAIPGQPNRVWVQSDKPGRYLGFCAEYCGASHARMLILVFADDEATFSSWVSRERTVSPGAVPDEKPLSDGLKVFQSRTCVNCHRIAGTSANATVGPDLSHLGARLTLASGVLPNTEANLKKWIARPTHFKPGAHMPDFDLPPQDLQSLAGYLEALK